MTHNAFTPALTAYRWYDDDNTEALSTSLQNENTSYEVDVTGGNVLLQLRIGIDETGNDSGNNNVNTQLRYDHEGGGATVVTGGSSVVLGTADANTPLTDLASTTNRATNGLTDASTFYAGRQICDGVDDDGTFDYIAAQFTEHVYPVTIIASDVGHGDTITFDTTIDGTPVTNVAIPTLTVFNLKNIEGSLFEDTEDFSTYEGEVAAGDNSQGIQGTRFNDSDDLIESSTGIQVGTFNMEGSLFTDDDIFFQGLLTYLIEFTGAFFVDADFLFDGEVILIINGSFLDDSADTFFDGLVSPQTLDGSLLTDTDTFFDSQIDLLLFGSLLEDGDIFSTGLVSPIALSGSLFTDADTLFDGNISLVINGSLFTNTNTLFNGLVSPQNLFGSLLDTQTNIYTGTVSGAVVNIEGPILQDVDILNHGFVNPTNLFGSRIEQTNTLNQGELSYNINGSSFTEENIYTGAVNLASGTQSLDGSLFTDTDIFYGALVETTGIQGSLHPNANSFFSGDFSLSIRGSNFIEENIYTGIVTAGVVDVESSILQNVSSFNGASLSLLLHGSLLETQEILNHGEVGVAALSIEASHLANENIINSGDIDLLLYGSLLTNQNILYHGAVSNFAIEGSILIDPDIFYGGVLTGGAAPTITDSIRIYSGFHIVGTGAEIVDLADEITLAEQGASAEGTVHLGILIDDSSG